MPNNIWVMIVEHDLYARDMMSLLLTRDWRTRVTAETNDRRTMKQVLYDRTQRIDLILLDTEVPDDPLWPFELAADAISRRAKSPIILCTGKRLDAKTLKRVHQNKYAGYILESEMQYGLAEAVERAVNGWFVITPAIQEFLHSEGYDLPPKTAVIDGKPPIDHLTDREKEVARLALLFSHSRPEIADELQYANPTEVRSLVARVYRGLGLTDLMNGITDPEDLFKEGKVLQEFKKAQKGSRNNLSTLAFHLLTRPDVVELP